MITENLTLIARTSTARDYWQLLKARLSGLVAFSAALAFLMGSTGSVDWVRLFALVVGGFALTGAANIINQIIERDLDRRMARTQQRPLATGVINPIEGATFALAIGLSGFFFLFFLVNSLTAVLTLLALVLYGFLYTPLKQKSSLAVLVGAVPGAMPPLIGWAGATGTISHEAIILFAIQFIWQFPHFWAIAWVLDEDYRKAGFRLLPNGGKTDQKSAFHIMIYTLTLIPLAAIPTLFGMTGWISALVAMLAGVLFLWPTLQLMRDPSRKTALRIMFGSFLYLPLVQIAYLLDKL